MLSGSEEMIGYCGIDCTSCDAFIATQANDSALREKTAKKWSKEFNYPGLRPEDISCNGCLSNGPLFSHCHDCEIRKCAMEKGVKNCAYCSDYPCEKLQKFHERVPSAKATLDGLRYSLKTKKKAEDSV